MAAWVTTTNAAYLEMLREDALDLDGETNWTVPKSARPGDVVVLYCAAPVSAVAAVAIVASEPAVISEAGNPWLGHWAADLIDLRLIEPAVERRKLIEMFPGWGFWRQPRVGCLVPIEHELRFLAEALGGGARYRHTNEREGEVFS